MPRFKYISVAFSTALLLLCCHGSGRGGGFRVGAMKWSLPADQKNGSPKAPPGSPA